MLVIKSSALFLSSFTPGFRFTSLFPQHLRTCNRFLSPSLGPRNPLGDSSRRLYSVKMEIQSNQVPMETDVKHDFDLISSVKANGVHPVTKYRSRSTGLELVHASIPGPVVNGYIVLATRAEDHDGLPHTLEHMIFLGSDEYPYKGILDILANKCLASGTNAWTDVDHTCYTMTTAGSEGFCTLLPIYMDHIFYPILSDTAFSTEVYHINGEGKDGGVVYSEMQALEQTGEIRAHTELIRSIYPKTSGYHYNTGGQLSNLRDSCNNTKVKAFHKKFYNPKNARLIVAGMVELDQLFAALQPIVLKLQAKKSVPETWTRPWLDEVPELEKSVDKVIKFASEDEDDALVVVGFRGPSAIRELPEVHAARILLDYLTDSTVSPLEKEFVENDDPLASSISFSEMENSQTTFYLELEGVPLESTSEIAPRIRKTLTKQLKEFDMERMKDVIRKSYLEEMSAMENTPHNSIAYACIGDFLYSEDASSVHAFEQRVSVGKILQRLMDEPSTFWTERLQKMILDQNWVTIQAKPSKDQYEQQMKQEEAMVEERMYKFGPDGFKKFELELEDAIKKNMTPVPMSFISKIQTPSIDSITFHDITRHDNPDFANDVKCNFYLDDIHSNFVYLSVLIDTSSLPVDQRKYLSLFCEALTESAVKLDNGEIISHEKVVAELNRDFLSYGCGIGIDGGSRFKCGSYSHIISFNAQFEIAKAPNAFEWIKRLFWQTQFKGDRLKVLSNKMSTDVNQLKRKGSRMCKLLIKDVLYEAGSNTKITSMIRQQLFLKEVASTVAKSENKVRKILEIIRDLIHKPENVTVHIATSMENLQNAHKDLFPNGPTLPKEWLKIFSYEGKEPVKRLANEPDIGWMKDHATLTKSPQQYILGLSSEESSFLAQGILAITDFNDPELPIVLTVNQYFCQMEGPFFRSIRGAGLAYDYFMDSKANDGMLYFNLYRSSDLVGAYKTAVDTVLELLDGKVEWQQDLLATAKSSLIFEIIEGEKTPLALASTSLCSYFRNVPEGHTRQLIRKIAEVTPEELKAVAEKYFRPLFTQPCHCAIVCPTDKVSLTVDGFAKLGKKLTIMPSIGSSFLAK
ncbi:unnamed protein product [Allacma fusca]|uniref:Peptidase M16C associated domain-containing protein n=1 Tax=Allacma fusca TaxID=39272 RepID=A0A8J2L1T9_9HEXA|nr:unnamed protein product [Allacma fusca]